MKKIVLSFLVLSSMISVAQNSSNSSAGTATGITGSSIYSVGQVVYTSINNTNGSINQGIQIPFEINTLGVDSFPQIQLQIMVYPNPTPSNAVLKIDNYDFQNLSYQIIDFQGKQLAGDKIQNTETTILLEKYAKAVYFLTVFSNNTYIKTFKIIKN